MSAASTNGFAADVANNTLPTVSWIVGPDYGSEHPAYEPGVGANFLQLMLNALASNTNVYANTVFIYNIDEGDGFYDHDIPILPPAGTTNEFVTGAPIGLGERVPCIIVSPWTRGGYVCSQVFDHTSRAAPHGRRNRCAMSQPQRLAPAGLRRFDQRLRLHASHQRLPLSHPERGGGSGELQHCRHHRLAARHANRAGPGTGHADCPAAALPAQRSGLPSIAPWTIAISS